MSALSESPLESGWATPPVYARYSVQLGKMLDEKRIAGTHLAPYLRNIDVQWDGINTDDLPQMDFTDEDRERYSLREGDLLVCEGGEVGRTAIWKGQLRECFFQKALHRLRPTSNRDDPRFFRYFMRMAVERKDFSVAIASTIQHLTAEKLRVVRYPAPPISKQRAIADYLDGETARLDALVQAKEKILALLVEKRQALLTRAVTRGLDANAPVRDSGIPWLGPIPAHWTVKRLKYLGLAIIGLTFNPSDTVPDDSGLLVLRASNVRDEKIVLEDNIYVSMDVPSELLTRIGDILVCSRSGSRALVGKSAQIDERSAGFTFGTFMTVFRSPFNDYLFLVFNSPLFDYQAGAFSTSTINQLTIDTLKNLEVPMPSESERREIVAYVNVETQKFDRLINRTQHSIALLRERRSTIIAAAVTGQIEVA